MNRVRARKVRQQFHSLQEPSWNRPVMLPEPNARFTLPVGSFETVPGAAADVKTITKKPARLRYHPHVADVYHCTFDSNSPERGEPSVSDGIIQP